MINIGIIRFNQGNFGGIEKQILNNISNLDSNNYCFVLITNKETTFSELFKKYGDVYYINTNRIWQASRIIKQIIEEKSISIIQSHMLREHYIGCLVKARLRKVFHIFRIHTYINCSFISMIKKRLYHFLAFLLSKNVDLYLPINEKNKEELLNYTKVNNKKVKVIHDGVTSLKSIIRKESFNYTDLAMIANFDYGKGHDIAIRALKILVDKNPKYNITFIGYEKNRANDGKSITEGIKQLAKELGVDKNIKFLGFVENVGEAVNDIDIIILPSYSEGTPNCLLEAMSAKKIAIASNVGGIPEFVIDGENGFLHENKNYEELAKKILELPNIKKEELNKIRNKGYETWKEEYSVESLCSNMESIYKEKGVNI